MVRLFLLIALVAVLAILAYATVPPLFGYVGSEAYEWRSLGILVYATPVALFLGLMLWLEWCSRHRKDN